MKKLYILLLLGFTYSFSFGQNINVGVSTPDGELTLHIDYTAIAALNPPFSFWNNQVVTLRWPVSEGPNLIASVNSTTGLIFTTDGAATEEGGFYYQKVISSSVNINLPFTMNETKTMAIINLVSNGADPAIDIEVLDNSNAWNLANAGGPFVNNVFGNEFNMLSTTSANVLPIELSSFDVTKGDRTADLTWATSSEVNGSHFEIERSQDGTNWNYVGKVNAVGESVINQGYAYTDNTLPLNSRDDYKIFYYRLKLVDNDGSFDYSEIRSVRFDLDGEANFLVYPNPSYNEVYVNLSAVTTETGPATLQVIDIQGQLVKQVSLNTSDDIRVDVSNLTPGAYNFVARHGEQNYVQKVIKIQ